MHIINTSHIWHIDYDIKDRVVLWLPSPDTKGIVISPKNPSDAAHLEDLNRFVGAILSAKGDFITVPDTLKYN
jgi:hypothetical protein